MKQTNLTIVGIRSIAFAAWALSAMFALPLLAAAFDETARTKLSPLSIALLISGVTISVGVAILTTWRVWVARTSPIGPAGAVTDSAVSIPAPERKMLDFVPLRMFVLIVVFATAFALGRLIGTPILSEYVPRLPMALQNFWLHLAIIGGLGSFLLGWPETRFVWHRYITLGLYPIPGPVTLGLIVGYLSCFHNVPGNLLSG